MVHVEKIKESQNLEFKRSLAEIKEILQSISAFANKQGGKILVGIEEAKDGTVKEVVGIKIKGREIENLTNQIKQNTDPVIFPSIKIKKIESKEVLFMEVEENMFKPVFAKGSAFIRVGRTNRKLSSQEIRNMAKESSDYNFTELVCNEAQLKDIDEEKINIFVQKAKEERNFNLKYSSKKDFLKKMHLLSKESLRYSAILLYGKNPQEFVLQSEVRCGRFKGIKSLEFDDMEVIKGTLIEQADRIMSFIKRNLKVKATFAEGIERKEEWEYPLLALKEGVVNAVCHRDYALSANVQVRIFDDRLEIWSSGGLPFGLTVAKLKGKHESRPRNKEIANTFFMTKLIEQWGTGTNRMIELCKEHNLPEPLFEDTKSSFIITFRKYSIIQENLEGLNERQKKAVEFLLKHKKITNKQYHYLNSDITDKTVFRDLQDLVDKKIVLAKGEKKGRYYELLK